MKTHWGFFLVFINLDLSYYKTLQSPFSPPLQIKQLIPSKSVKMRKALQLLAYLRHLRYLLHSFYSSNRIFLFRFYIFREIFLKKTPKLIKII